MFRPFRSLFGSFVRHGTFKFRFGFANFVTLHFTTPYWKPLSQKSQPTRILFSSCAGLFDKFQYQAVSVQNKVYFHQELGSVLKIHCIACRCSDESDIKAITRWLTREKNKSFPLKYARHLAGKFPRRSKHSSFKLGETRNKISHRSSDI